MRSADDSVRERRINDRRATTGTYPQRRPPASFKLTHEFLRAWRFPVLDFPHQRQDYTHELHSPIQAQIFSL